MLYDAHNHLQDERLDPWRPQVMAELATSGLTEAVVNGTSEEDWQAVASLARQHSWVRPSFGLHPWYVRERSHAWSERLADLLRQFPQSAVGEIGLDRWIENPDVEAQLHCFRTQLALAREMDRPVTIHCLRAWGMLEEELRTQPLPTRGFLLHSYGGPVEMIPGFVKHGAYFSLSPYFGHPRKAAQLETFKSVPIDRLLAETDAPDMRPPDFLNDHPLVQGDQSLNHPANLRVSYELLAKLRGIPMEELADQMAENYRRLFIG
ncbi:TatD DNase family protein [Prosthecobacter fusiformis]|uniref:TatD DNase family protein n=1 Tax=Prosthecobacter fusiformis TaxID=48464 RepID=A0A4R7S1B5_9BACT|nr:TatD family hydrolase [Prosthecobacter fusiformis]TDU71198.1 TatD DNase family protein [Prosthecobacter fusiformis]